MTAKKYDALIIGAGAVASVFAAKLAEDGKKVLILEYDGRHYHGFQLQAGLPTVQGAIEAALRKLTGERTRVMAASRTDAGVHAQGQVVSFRTGSLTISNLCVE